MNLPTCADCGGNADRAGPDGSWDVNGPKGNRMPVPYRLSIGLLILAGLLIVDLVRYRGRSKRLGEYAFLTSTVVLCACLCLVIDNITFTISPEYFTWGKMLGASATRLDVARFALYVSWPPALVAAALLLFANSTGNAPSLGYGALYRSLGYVVLCLVATAVAGGLWFYAADPFHLRAELPSWSHEVQSRFLAVQGSHLGAYMGGATASLGAAAWIVRNRSRSTRRKD